MCPTIRVDDEVYGWLQKQARPFEDTPNSVLRRIANLALEAKQPTKAVGRSEKTAQSEFRAPIMSVLLKHGGQAARQAVLRDLEKLLSKTLTDYDKQAIDSGDVRWQKSAEWEVRVMREAGLLKAANDGPRGYWILSARGQSEAKKL